MEPPESSSTFSLKAVSVCPTMVSNGLTSAYTNVTSGSPEASGTSAVAVLSFAASAVVSAAAVAAASVAAAYVAAAVVVVSGDFSPHPAREATIAALNARPKNLFFMIHFLLYNTLVLPYVLIISKMPDS